MKDATPARRAAAAALVLVAALVAFLLWPRDGSTSPAPAPPPAPSAAVPQAAVAPEAKPAATNAEAPAAAAAPGAAERKPDLLLVKTNVPGAKVTVRYRHVGSEPEPDPASATCDGKGEASFALPSHPDFLVGAQVEASAPGYGGAESFAWSDARRVVLELRPDTGRRIPDPDDGTLTISGRVSFPDGRPVPGATVNVEATTGGFWEAVTDDDGEYVTRGFRPGRFIIECGQAEGQREVESGATGVDFTVAVHLVHVRFVDARGRPFRWAGWHHEIWKEGKLCDRGRTPGNEPSDRRIPVPAGGTLKVSARAARHPITLATLDAEGPPAFHDFPVVIDGSRAQGALAVRLRTDTGEPPKQVFLTAWNEMGDLAGHVGLEGEVKTAADGRVLMAGMSPGRVTVEANTQRKESSHPIVRDYGLPAAAEVVVEAGKTIDVDLTVALGGRIAVTVRGPDGAMLTAGDLKLLDTRGEEVVVPFYVHGEDGSWGPPSKPATAVLYHPVPPGPYTLEILRDEEVVASRPVSVPRAETLEVEIRLEK